MVMAGCYAPTLISSCENTLDDRWTEENLPVSVGLADSNPVISPEGTGVAGTHPNEPISGTTLRHASGERAPMAGYLAGVVNKA